MDKSLKVTMLKSMGFPMKERYESVTLTPTMAELLLEKFNNNIRKLNINKAKEYAKEMRSGRWTAEESATFIRFNEDLDMEDGQHRIKAITLAKVPVTMMVAWNCSHKENIDIGMKRSEMIFYKDGTDWITTDIKAMAKQKLTLDQGIMAYGQCDANVNLSRSIIKNEIISNKNLYLNAQAIARSMTDSVRGYYKIQRGLIGGIYAHLISSGYPEDMVEKFTDRIKNWRTDKKVENTFKGIKKDSTKNKVVAWLKIWAETNGLSTRRANKVKRFTDVEKPSFTLMTSAAE